MPPFTFSYLEKEIVLRMQVFALVAGIGVPNYQLTATRIHHYLWLITPGDRIVVLVLTLGLLQPRILSPNLISKGHDLPLNWRMLLINWMLCLILSLHVLSIIKNLLTPFNLSLKMKNGNAVGLPASGWLTGRQGSPPVLGRARLPKPNQVPFSLAANKAYLQQSVV